MIVVEGPEQVLAEPKSFTGQYLKPLLERSSPSPLVGEGRGEGPKPKSPSSPAKAGAQPEKKTRRKAAASGVDQDAMAGAK